MSTSPIRPASRGGRSCLTREVLDYGIDAGWNDNNEYGLCDDDATAAGFGEPAPLTLMRPVEALLMTRATREAQLAARPNLRPFTVTRAGGPGLQRYAQTWSGDNTTSWGSQGEFPDRPRDVALGAVQHRPRCRRLRRARRPAPELLIRWTQAGVLHPRFLMNSWKDDGVTTSPWLHPEALPAIREALRLRLRLMPYLYSAMVRAHEAHVPVLAPTFFAFDDDPETFADADAAMFGPCLLAAPVLREGAREVEVYLPRGPESWRDVWTGRVHDAGRSADDSGPARPAAAAGAGRRDRADDRQRRRLFAPVRRAFPRLAVFPGAARARARRL